MTVPTLVHSPNAPVFSQRDLRDPALLGWALLVRRQEGKAPLSEVYDRDAVLLSRIPAWAGDGLMSNDPAQHHSKVKQTHLTQTPAPGGQA